MERINVQVDQIGSNEPVPIVTTDALIMVATDNLKEVISIINENCFDDADRQQWLMDTLSQSSSMVGEWHGLKKEFEVELEVRGMCTMLLKTTRQFTATTEEEAQEMAQELFDEDPEKYIYESGENLIDEAAETWELDGADYEIEY